MIDSENASRQPLQQTVMRASAAQRQPSFNSLAQAMAVASRRRGSGSRSAILEREESADSSNLFWAGDEESEESGSNLFWAGEHHSEATSSSVFWAGETQPEESSLFWAGEPEEDNNSSQRTPSEDGLFWAGEEEGSTGDEAASQVSDTDNLFHPGEEEAHIPHRLSYNSGPLPEENVESTMGSNVPRFNFRPHSRSDPADDPMVEEAIEQPRATSGSFNNLAQAMAAAATRSRSRREDSEETDGDDLFWAGEEETGVLYV